MEELKKIQQKAGKVANFLANRRVRETKKSLGDVAWNYNEARVWKRVFDKYRGAT